MWDRALYRCGAGTEGRENPPSVYLPGALSSPSTPPPRRALGNAATRSLAGGGESECEKVSQAKERGELQVLRQNTFFFLSPFYSFKPNPQTTPIPRNKGASLDRPLFVFWFQSKQVMQEDREKSPTVGTGGGKQADLSSPGCIHWAPVRQGVEGRFLGFCGDQRPDLC